VKGLACAFHQERLVAFAAVVGGKHREKAALECGFRPARCIPDGKCVVSSDMCRRDLGQKEVIRRGVYGQCRRTARRTAPLTVRCGGGWSHGAWVEAGEQDKMRGAC